MSLNDVCMRLFEKWAKPLREKAPASMRFTQEQIDLLRRTVKVICEDNKIRIKGVSKASKLLKKSRQTIYYAIAKYYFKKKIRKKEYEATNFYETGFYQYLRERVKTGRIAESTFKNHVTYGKQFFEFIGKDFDVWTRDDFKKIMSARDEKPNWFDKRTGKISYNVNATLRQIAKYLKYDDLLDPDSGLLRTKGLKIKGAKLTHYLNEEQVKGLMINAPTPDLVLLVLVGVQTGARISSLTRLKLSDIDKNKNIAKMYEPKIKAIVYRILGKKTIRLIEQFYRHYQLSVSSPLFPRPKGFYTKALRQIGERVKVNFPVTAHILKHTAVSLMSLHGVPMDVINDQVHTDPQTLKEYYLGSTEKVKRFYLLGEKMEIEPWYNVVREFEDVAEKRLEQLFSTNGFKKKKKQTKPKPKKPRKLNEKAIISMLKSPKTPTKLKQAWINKLKQTKQGKEILAKAKIKA